MLYYYLFYFFIAVGAKLLLAMLMIYLLLPGDARCGECDGETLLIRPRLPGRLASRLALGRVQWRWCPRCGSEGMSRRTRCSGAAAPIRIPRPRRTRR